MALTEEEHISQMNVLEDGSIEVRRDTVIYRDGVEISRAFHRHVCTPGNDLTREHARVAAIGNVVHTAEVIEAYKVKHEKAD